MRWLFAPPDRREIFLLILCITTFTISYNLQSSLQYFGATSSGVFHRLGLSGKRHIGDDGRKLPGWRDPLENAIFGDFPWEQGHIAAHGDDSSQGRDADDPYEAIWVGKKAAENVGEGSVNDGFQRWGKNVPQTKILKHVPGYTILDNVILYKGVVYVVMEPRANVPPISSIVSVTAPGTNRWEFISPQDARRVIGEFGGMIRGVTWMSSDTIPDNSTLVSLWRAYSALDPHITSSGQTSLPPPTRLVFPNIPFFSDPDPPNEPPNSHYRDRRVRSELGLHHYTAKAAFPHLSHMYLQDWNDLHGIEVPLVFERIVVGDRVAAAAASASAFDIDGAPEDWWEPIRKNLGLFFDQYEPSSVVDIRRRKPVVTYLHRQSATSGPKVRAEDHKKLVRALTRMRAQYGYDVRIVSSSSSGMWAERMQAVLESSVVIGVYGGDMMDATFVKSGEGRTIMEFFPSETYFKDMEVVARALGVGYVALWNDRKFTDTMPHVSSPGGEQRDVPVDAETVVKAIHEALSR